MSFRLDIIRLKFPLVALLKLSTRTLFKDAAIANIKHRRWYVNAQKALVKEKPLFPPRIPHGLAWDWNWASVFRGQRRNFLSYGTVQLNETTEKYELSMNFW